MTGMVVMRRPPSSAAPARARQPPNSMSVASARPAASQRKPLDGRAVVQLHRSDRQRRRHAGDEIAEICLGRAHTSTAMGRAAPPAPPVPAGTAGRRPGMQRVGRRGRCRADQPGAAIGELAVERQAGHGRRTRRGRSRQPPGAPERVEGRCHPVAPMRPPSIVVAIDAQSASRPALARMGGSCPASRRSVARSARRCRRGRAG